MTKDEKLRASDLKAIQFYRFSTITPNLVVSHSLFTTSTIRRPLYGTGQQALAHLQLRIRGFFWCKVLLTLTLALNEVSIQYRLVSDGE